MNYEYQGELVKRKPKIKMSKKKLETLMYWLPSLVLLAFALWGAAI